MFADHQPLLAKLGRSGPDGFARISTFVVLTIRQPLWAAVLDYPLVRTGRTARSVFGSKHRALGEIESEKRAYYEQCERLAADADGEDLENGLLYLLTHITGVGPAKAGFISQMIYGVSGCLDTHNLTRFGLGLRPFRYGERNLDGIKPGRRLDAIASYNGVVRKLGGPAALWDSWCRYVSDRDPVNYPSPDRVSELHLTPLLA